VNSSSGVVRETTLRRRREPAVGRMRGRGSANAHAQNPARGLDGPHATEKEASAREGCHTGQCRHYRGALRGCWLNATPPRIDAADTAMLAVSGSASTSHAHNTANKGIR